MKLIIGLGNPGTEYSNTRHNIGFLAINKIIESFDISKSSRKYNSTYYELHNLKGKKIIFLMPETYMNNSGIAVQAFCSFFKISPDKLIVIHDDIDLELGKVKVKIGGGNGGHNGLKSIDQHIGQSYLRIRLGIGKPKDETSVADYVLQNFCKSETEAVNKMINFITENIPNLLHDNVNSDDISRFLAAYSKKP